MLLRLAPLYVLLRLAMLCAVLLLLTALIIFEIVVLSIVFEIVVVLEIVVRGVPCKVKLVDPRIYSVLSRTE
jgi:hypothetical protein